MKKLIINLCPTGMITNKHMTPYVPQSPEEIISDVLECSQLGVSMVHLHACDADGKPSYQKDIYAKIIDGIRQKRADLILVVSTSGRTFNEFEYRSQVLELEGDFKPDMASLTLGSLNFPKCASTNSPEMITRLAVKMQERNIKPELEVFDTGMVNYAKYLITKGILKPPYYFNIILGNIATAQAKLQHLCLIVSELPENSYWSLGGIGLNQKYMNMLGMIAANGIRIGLEDNIWFDDDKEILATNYSLVERIIKTTQASGREIATPIDVRNLFNLSQLMTVS